MIIVVVRRVCVCGSGEETCSKQFIIIGQQQQQPFNQATMTDARSQNFKQIVRILVVLARSSTPPANEQTIAAAAAAASQNTIHSTPRRVIIFWLAGRPADRAAN